MTGWDGTDEQWSMTEDMRDVAEEPVEGVTSETLEPNDEAAAKAAEAEAARKRLTIVTDHIRRESRAARIVAPATFAEEPFSYTEEQLEGVWEAIASDPEFADIVRTADEKSGAEFLHSTKYLSLSPTRACCSAPRPTTRSS